MIGRYQTDQKREFLLKGTNYLVGKLVDRDMMSNVAHAYFKIWTECNNFLLCSLIFMQTPFIQIF